MKKKNWKKEAWKWFSQYIRLKSSDINGTVKCVTCGALMFWKYSQAGHFVDGRTNSLLLREDLVHVQCPACNLFRNGNKFYYTKYMLSLGYTMEDLDEFHCLRNQIKKVTPQEWESSAKEYKEKVEELLMGKVL